MLMKASSQSLTEQLAQRFAERIRSRLLAPGARLPSVRQCAQQQGVSPSTVVAAYDQLLAQGLVEARRNRGFFVREMAAVPAKYGEDASEGAAEAASARPAGAVRNVPIDATALIRGMFQPPGRQPMPGLGTLPETWLDAPLLQRAQDCGLLPDHIGTRAADAYRELRRAQHRARLDEQLTQVDPDTLAEHRDAVLALWRTVFG